MYVLWAKNYPKTRMNNMSIYIYIQIFDSMILFYFTHTYEYISCHDNEFVKKKMQMSHKHYI